MGSTALAMEQYRAMLREIEECTRERSRLERWCVVGCVAAFAYLAQSADLYGGAINYVWFMPVVLAFYGLLKSLSLDARIRTLGQCLQTLEVQLNPGAHSALDRSRWEFVVGRRRGARVAWALFLALTVYASYTAFQNAWESDEDADTDQAAVRLTNTRHVTGI